MTNTPTTRRLTLAQMDVEVAKALSFDWLDLHTNDGGFASSFLGGLLSDLACDKPYFFVTTNGRLKLVVNGASYLFSPSTDLAQAWRYVRPVVNTLLEDVIDEPMGKEIDFLLSEIVMVDESLACLTFCKALLELTQPELGRIEILTL